MRPTSSCSLTACAAAADAADAARGAAQRRRGAAGRGDHVRARGRLVLVARAPLLARRCIGSQLQAPRRLELRVEERDHDLLADRRGRAPRTSRAPRRGTRRAGPSAPSRAGARPRAGSPCSRGARASAVDDLEDHEALDLAHQAPGRAPPPRSSYASRASSRNSSISASRRSTLDLLAQLLDRDVGAVERLHAARRARRDPSPPRTRRPVNCATPRSTISLDPARAPPRRGPRPRARGGAARR